MPRLVELEAVFVRLDPPNTIVEIGCNACGAQGIWFICPTKGHDHGVLVWFKNPIDNDPVPPEMCPHARWQRIGETLDTLSLAPSINLPGDWHGFVLSGEAK